MKTLLLAAIGLTVMTASARAATNTEVVASDARSQIEQVITRFQTAIIKKNKAALSELFLPAKQLLDRSMRWSTASTSIPPR